MAVRLLVRNSLRIVFALVVFSGVAWGQSLESLLMHGLDQYDHTDYHGALDTFNRGLELAKKMNHRAGIGTFLGNIGTVYRSLGEYQKALSCFESAIEIAREIDEPSDEGSMLGNIGVLCLDLGDYPKAISYLQKAAEVFERIGNLPGKEAAAGNIGNVYVELMNYAEALSCYEKALRISRETGNKKGEGTWLGNMGSVYGRLGEHMKALQHFEQALKVAREIGDRLGEESWIGCIGLVYSNLGDYSNALLNYEQSLKISREIGDRKGEATCLSNIGLHHNYLDDYPQAISYFEQALSVERQIGVQTAQTEANIGDVYLEQGNKEKAYSVFKRLDMPLRLGRCYLQFQDYREARNEFLRILPALENIGNSETLVADYIGLGLSHEGLKEYAASREYYLKAVESIEREREGLAEPQRRNFFSGKMMGFSRLDPYEGLVRVSSRQDDASEAIYWAENTRARLLLEAISHRPSGKNLDLPQNLSKRELDLTTQMAAIQKQIGVARERNPHRYEALVSELAALRTEIDSFVALLRREYPQYAALQYPQPMRPKEFHLNVGEVLLEYEVAETETFAWLIRGSEILKTVTIPISRKKLAEEVRRYRGFFEGIGDNEGLSRFDPVVGEELYDLLVKDLVRDLKAGEPIILVPDEVLAILPFDALVASLPSKPAIRCGEFGPYPVGVTYLGDLHPITVYQSGTALSLARSTKGARTRKEEKMLVLADPIFDSREGQGWPANKEYGMRLRRVVTDDWQKGRNKTDTFPRLHGTALLADKLKLAFEKQGVDILKGADATKHRLMALPLKQYRYQVFATHGILDNEIPYIREPALVLSEARQDSENGEEGFLRMTEVMGLELDADLVALPACNTGIGKNQNGEGVMGMGRAFQYAGSRAVLMSLWSVEDESTNIFTERFFAHLQQGKDQLESLMLARSDLRRVGYEHPFFWAPFILVGERR
jgi:CHAT domain-containing protein/tetratricopeptide (TPR) repeat protein